MALTASLDAPGRAGRPPYPANDVMARAGGDALALPAGRAGWAVVLELAMSGMVTPAMARSIAAITRKRTLVLSQPVCVRSSCMSTCLFMRSFGQAALRIPGYITMCHRITTRCHEGLACRYRETGAISHGCGFSWSERCLMSARPGRRLPGCLT